MALSAFVALALMGMSCDDPAPVSPERERHRGAATEVPSTSAFASCDGAALDLQRPFAAESGYAFLAAAPSEWPSDSTEDPRASTLVLLEDGRELGPPHMSHDSVREMGRGVFSHWNESLYFSSSDGSDPNENGRHYQVCSAGPRAMLRATPQGYPLPPSLADVALEPPFLHRGGFAWTIPLPQDWPSDGMHAGRRSKAMVYEDGQPLRPAHAEHKVLAGRGEGRFSHWNGLLHFSTSDNSDPNENGRSYTARVPVRRGLGEYGYRPLPRVDAFEKVPDPRTASPPRELSPEAADAPGHPRVIYWYTIDAIRRETVDAQLNGKPVMPSLAKFKAESVSFSSAYVNASNTKMSTATMFTGMWPTRHRVMAAVFPVWPRGGEFALGLDHRYTTLAESMRDSEYHTWTHHYTVFIEAGSGLLQGFQRDDLADGRPVPIAEPPERFFAYEHTLGAHAPYFPSPEAVERFGLPPASEVDPSSAAWYTQTLSDEAAAELKDYHLAEAYDADLLFEERMEWLRKEGLWDDALIIVTSDHGEEFLEHGRTTHSTQLYEETVRVPLMIKFPRENEYASMHGVVLPHRVSMVDLYPTVLELTGAAPPPYVLDGRSLLPILRDEEEPGERMVVMRMAANLNRKPAGGMFLFVTDAIISGKLKAMFGYRIQDSQDVSESYRQGDWIAELYDLSDDPGETRNLATERPADFLRLAQEHFATNRPLDFEGASDRDAEAPGFDVDDDRMSRLKELGYVE